MANGHAVGGTCTLRHRPFGTRPSAYQSKTQFFTAYVKAMQHSQHSWPRRAKIEVKRGLFAPLLHAYVLRTPYREAWGVQRSSAGGACVAPGTARSSCTSRGGRSRRRSCSRPRRAHRCSSRT